MSRTSRSISRSEAPPSGDRGRPTNPSASGARRASGTKTSRSSRPAGLAWSPRSAPDLPREAHKGDAGRVLSLCGSRNMPGAAVLVARAAQRAGAGLVTAACFDESLRAVLPVAAPEAVLLDLATAAKGKKRNWSTCWKDRADHARVSGPGLGTTPAVRDLVLALVRDDFTGALVLDADALNVIGEELELFLPHAGPLVLTPHPGEAARLLGRAVPREGDGRIEAALEISRRTRSICCLKGHATVVAEGDRVYVNETGNPGMATAGAGDVLAGILGAYLAISSRGPFADWRPFEAVASAVHVHGLAGDLAAKELGERAIIASDLIDFLPDAQLEFKRASNDSRRAAYDSRRA